MWSRILLSLCAFALCNLGLVINYILREVICLGNSWKLVKVTFIILNIILLIYSILYVSGLIYK
jgi:hypothetical protein